MDNELFLQHLRDLSLEEGRVFIQEHASELADHAAIGNLIADEALRFLYSPFVSLKLAELLIFFGEFFHHPSSHALGLKAKGDALVQLGHYHAAIENLDAAGENFLSLGDDANWARSRISWITASASLGHVEEALQEGARARAIFLQQNDYYWVCVIDHNIAWIYEEVGRYQDALKLYEAMLAIYPTLTNQSEIFIKRSTAVAQMNQAINLSWLGKFEQAYRLLQEAQASFVALEDTSLIIYSELDLVSLDYTQGYYGSVLRRYYQARDSMIQNSVENPLLLAELKLWTANCLVKLNRAQEACQLMDEAVEVYRQLGTSLQTSNALREYATTLVTSGRRKEALATLDEACALFDSKGFDRYAFSTKLQRTELLLELGYINEAYNQARLIKEYFEIRGLVAQSVRASLVMVGALIENLRRPMAGKEQESTLIQEAVLLCKHAFLQARQHNLQEEVYKSQHFLGQLFAFQGNLRKAAKHFSAAIVQIERILDDLVYDLSPSFLHTTWTVYEDMISLCLQQSQFEKAFSYLEQARSMALRQYINKSKIWQERGEIDADTTSTPLLQQHSAAILRTQYELRDWQQRYHDYNVLLAEIDTSVPPTFDREVLQAELKRCEAKISELFERLHLYQTSTPVKSHTARSKKGASAERSVFRHIDIEQLRLHLAPDQLLLAYYLYRGKLVIFAITTEGLITYENPDGVAQLERLLPLLHAHLQPGGWPDLQHPPQQVIRHLLHKLYNLLVAPVASLLPSSAGHLTIVPYGLLHELPFHALFDGSHFLIENFQINYLPASNILMHVETSRSGEDVSSDITEDLNGPGQIQESLLQANGVGKSPLVFGYSGKGHLQRVLSEAETVAKLLNGRCHVEGEATIARLTEEASGSPVIHIATHGQSRLDAPNFSYVQLADGQLNAIDAFSLNLKECEMVTLSGCETGLALSGGGDEQVGLGRAFLAAGASSLVMSLWPVEDHATNELMELFYQSLLEGESRAQALRTAQCSLLHRTSSIYAHPYFWAAFRLVGEVSPLTYKRAKDLSFAFESATLKK